MEFNSAIQRLNALTPVFHSSSPCTADGRPQTTGNKKFLGIPKSLMPPFSVAKTEEAASTDSPLTIYQATF